MTRKTYTWNTWTAERPAELLHLATGLRLTPVLYSDRASHATDLQPGELLRLGQRGMQDGSIRFETIHEETHLNWTCVRDSEDALSLEWRCQSHGEWGLRYWVNLCLSGPDGTEFSYDEDSGMLSGCGSDWSVKLRTSQKPLLVTAHEDVGGLIDEYASHGYFYLGSRAQSGSCVALRFNLDETPNLRLDLSMSQSNLTASAHTPLPSEVNSAQASLQAIHDVLDWNHVWDAVNNRPYTVLTRNWNQRKFGGFGVWMNDILLHAHMWGLFDPDRARENIEAVFTGQTEAGNFPCLITGNDAWLDRSQPPVATYVVWSLFERTGDTELLEWAYPHLLRNHNWWWSHRVLDKSGLVAFGTSTDVGSGLYKGTKLAARNESGMDNMAVHDEAEFDPKTGLLQSADIGLNAMLALDGELLARIAVLVGEDAEADEISSRTDDHKARVRTELWDQERGVFANRLTDGRFVRALAPTSFFPLVAGIATQDQVLALVKNYLTPEDKFGGRFSLPSASRDGPAFQDNTYWRGRVWGPLNYWVYQGLRRYGMFEPAQDLARKSAKMFADQWVHRHCGENYDPVTGKITNQPDADRFYTWGALLPMLAVNEVVYQSPWDGLTIDLKLVGVRIGPILCELGVLQIETSDQYWIMKIDGREVLSGIGLQSLRNISLSRSEFEATLESNTNFSEIGFQQNNPVDASLEDTTLQIKDRFVKIPAHPDAMRLVVRFAD